MTWAIIAVDETEVTRGRSGFELFQVTVVSFDRKC